MCSEERTLFLLCYCAQEGLWLVRWQSDPPMGAIHYFCLQWERKEENSFPCSLLQTQEKCSFETKRWIEKHSLFGKAGQMGCIYILSWFWVTSIWKILFQDRNWETTWFWIARWENNWLSYIRSSLLNLICGYNSATLAWHIQSFQHFWCNLLFFLMQVWGLFLTTERKSTLGKSYCLNSCKAKWYRATKRWWCRRATRSSAMSWSEKQDYSRGGKFCGQARDFSVLIKW